MGRNKLPVILLCVCNFSYGQFIGETFNNFGQVFSSVDTDLDDNLFENFVDFVGGDAAYDYDDQLPSESQLTEEQLTARQVKLRELYKGRRPVRKDGSNGIRMNFLNRIQKPSTLKPFAKNKTETAKNKSELSGKEKLLDKHQSGMAVSVVKPPPGFSPSKEKSNVSESPASVSPIKKLPKNPLSDWNNRQKQRAALATSLIGTKLKNLKEKRKLLMNTDRVKERSDENDEDAKEPENDSLDEVFKRPGSQVLKVKIEEKSSESTSPSSKLHLHPAKKRRFKPQIKSSPVSHKRPIKNQLRDKNKLNVETVTKDVENVGERVIGDKIDATDLKDFDIDTGDEIISEEILDEVYGKLEGLHDKVEKLKASGEIEKKPTWMSKPKKKGNPLKKIDVEESAVPLSIIPHGVPLKRGFGNIEENKVLVLPPSPSPPPSLPNLPSPTPKSQVSDQPSSKTSVVTQFLQFLPVTSKPALQLESKTLEEDIMEEKVLVEDTDSDKTSSVEETSKSDNIISADFVNKEIEKVLEIKMPQHTELLYGKANNSGLRFERNPESSTKEVNVPISC